MVRLPLYPPPRPQSMGQVLDAGFELFRRTLAQCLPYGALLVIAGQLANFHDLAIGRLPHFGGSHDPAWWMWYGIGLVISLLLWGAILLRQDALATGGTSSMGTELRIALGRLPQLIAISVLSAAGVTIGLLLLIVPGLYVAVAFAFASPVLLLGRARGGLEPDGRRGATAPMLREAGSPPRRAGALAALAESVRLVRGHWWRTALTLALVVLMMLVMYAVLATIITAASISIAGVTSRELIAAVSAVAGVIVGSVTVPLGSAMILAIHADLACRAAQRPAGPDAPAAGPDRGNGDRGRDPEGRASECASHAADTGTEYH